MTGTWTTLRAPSSGMIVRVRETCLSGEKVPVHLGMDMIGSVSKVDREGDMFVYFPDLVLDGESDDIIVLREDFRKFERLVT